MSVFAIPSLMPIFSQLPDLSVSAEKRSHDDGGVDKTFGHGPAGHGSKISGEQYVSSLFIYLYDDGGGDIQQQQQHPLIPILNLPRYIDQSLPFLYL